jgi:hypothetical protein
MNATQILTIIESAVTLRNQIQTALAAKANVLPAVPAVPATGTTPAVEAQPAQATGQLINAASFIHTAALNIQAHLGNITTDADILKQAAALIATPAPAPAAATPKA